MFTQKNGITFNIPGKGDLHITRLFLDYDGTIAQDGSILPAVIFRLEKLALLLDIVVLTTDMHRFAADNLAWTGLAKHGVDLITLPPEHASSAKVAEMEKTSANTVATIGNGLDDVEILSQSALSIAVIGAEGCAKEAVQAAMVVTKSIEDALDLLLYPKRLVSTLSS